MKKTNSSNNNTNKILSELKNNGIQFFANTKSQKELKKLHFKKMSKRTVEHLSPLLQSLVQNLALTGSIKNTFTCNINPSLLSKSLKDSTGLLGIVRNKATGQISEQAIWKSFDFASLIKNPLMLAATAFNVLSFVVGQVHLADINKKLTKLNQEVSEIKFFLDIAAKSELFGTIEGLEEKISHLKYIQKDEKRIQQTISKIEDYMDTSRKQFSLNQQAVVNILEKEIIYKDKPDTIKENVNNMLDYLNSCKLALYLYIVCKTVVVYLNEIDDNEELIIYKKEIDEKYSEYIELSENVFTYLDDYLTNSKYLYEPSLSKEIFNTAVAIVDGLVIGSTLGIIRPDISGTLDKNTEDKIIKTRNNVIEEANEQFAQIQDIKCIDQYVNLLSNYIDTKTKNLQVVCLDGEFYMKYI